MVKLNLKITIQNSLGENIGKVVVEVMERKINEANY